MNKILILVKKELNSYFNSPLGYIVVSIFLLITGWLFIQGFFISSQASMRSFFGLIPFILMFILPAVTMSSWAEEKRSGTLELLLTQPITEMQIVLAKYLAAGVSSVVFGDIFLEDVRKYREDNLSKIGMQAIFPMWKADTTELAHRFIDLRFKAVITCVDSNVLDKKFVGRAFDEQFLSELPSSVDPCGENGEFHSFVYDGPIFRKRISHTIGEVVLRENRFYYCDLIPV